MAATTVATPIPTGAAPVAAVDENLITCTPFALGYILGGDHTTALDLGAAPFMLEIKQLALPEDDLSDLTWPIDATSVNMVVKILNKLRTTRR